MKTPLEKLLSKLVDTTKKLLKKSSEHDNLNDLSSISVELINSAYKQGCIDLALKERKVYYIDEPNYAYEITREASDGYYYAILYHPSHCDIKVLTESKKGETWFDTKEECIDARIKKIERDLEFEKNSKKRKLK
jgi:hypothetical protein